MLTITKITGNGMCCCSGGCHGADFVNMITFSDASSIKVARCACGNGCHGSFPINRIHEGMVFDDKNDFYRQFPAAETADINRKESL